MPTWSQRMEQISSLSFQHGYGVGKNPIYKLFVNTTLTGFYENWTNLNCTKTYIENELNDNNKINLFVRNEF